MKETMGHYYDIEPYMDMYSFAELFIVSLGYLNNNYLKEDGKIISELPCNYFDEFEKVMYRDNIVDGKNIVVSMFSKLFDINKFYDEKIDFQFELADNISILLNKYSKDEIADIKFNLRSSSFYIKMDEEQANKILENYDEETKAIMWQFVFNAFSKGDIETLANSKCNEFIGKRMVMTQVF